jgi:hypothetical protein
MLLTQRDEDHRVVEFSRWLTVECRRFSEERRELLSV